MQHEIDHLDGKLYIDYLDSLDDLISTEHDDDEDEEGLPAAARTAVG
jgi:peptide deformylase